MEVLVDEAVEIDEDDVLLELMVELLELVVGGLALLLVTLTVVVLVVREDAVLLEDGLVVVVGSVVELMEFVFWSVKSCWDGFV